MAKAERDGVGRGERDEFCLIPRLSGQIAESAIRAASLGARQLWERRLAVGTEREQTVATEMRR